LVTGQSSGNYDYDDIGNLIQDSQEGLSNIVWNVYGKIESVTHNTSSGKHDLEFRYNSKGERIMKIEKPRSTTSPYGPLDQSNWIYTLYERDAQGNVLATYNLTYTPQGGSLYTKNLTLLENDIYGSSRIGIYKRSTENISNNSILFTADITTTTGVFTNINTNPPNPIFNQKNIYSFTLNNNYGQKRYELVNHLGNVMNVVSDNKVGQVSSGAITYYKADPYRATDYYPFGQVMTDRNFANDEGTYRYGFNGMESDDEINGSPGTAYTALNWEYDPRLGRRWNIDPKYKSFLSPYAAFSNNPIINVDPFGDDDYYSRNGAYLGRVGEGDAVRIISKATYVTVRDNQGTTADFEAASHVAKFQDINQEDYLKNTHIGSKNAGREKGAFIVLDLTDAENPIIKYVPNHGKGTAHSLEVPVKTGTIDGDPVTYIKNPDGSYDPKIKVLGSVHGHIDDEKVGGVTETNNGEEGNDKKTAIDSQAPVYAVDAEHVHKVDQHGTVRNNKSLKTNVLKDALETHGNKPADPPKK
jgi:RHS repeat-associated protein